MTATMKSAMLAATLFGAGFAGTAIAQTARPHLSSRLPQPLP